MIALAIAAALAAAFFNALAGYLQHGASKQVPGRAALNVRALADLSRNRRWLAGAGCDVTAFGFQIGALALATLILVQPVLVTSLLMVVALRGWRGRTRPRPGTWIAALLTCVGLSVFLLAAQPQAGTSTPASDSPPLGLWIAFATVLAICFALAAMSSANHRAVALALAAGVLYGVTASLAKIVTGQLSEGLFEPLHHWMIYGLIVTAITGAQLTQTAFQAGALAAPIAVIMAADPLASIALGLTWLHERIATGPPQLVLEGLALACMVAGIGWLSREVPRVSREPEHTHSFLPGS